MLLPHLLTTHTAAYHWHMAQEQTKKNGEIEKEYFNFCLHKL